MTRIDWWVGVVLFAFAVIFHAAIPRYELMPPNVNSSVLIRFDRWTGTAELGLLDAKAPAPPWVKISGSSPN
jgi:hypothetical protein